MVTAFVVKASMYSLVLKEKKVEMKINNCFMYVIYFMVLLLNERMIKCTSSNTVWDKSLHKAIMVEKPEIMRLLKSSDLLNKIFKDERRSADQSKDIEEQNK